MVARLRQGLHSLERAYSAGHHGRWSARRRTDMVDEAVAAIGPSLGLPVALVALGGYGRRLLCPGSDVDLMVLHAERREARVRDAAERLFYPFWDAGIPLGHAVRSVRDCVRVAGERLDAATALLDARLVWGDVRLLERLRAEMDRMLARDPAGFVGRLAEARAARDEAFGSCSQILEPDLKEATGGLRDVHTTLWAGRALAGAGAIADLPPAGLLRATEARALEEAEEFLVRVRSALHLETGRRTDRLVLEQQPPLARALGFDATAGLDAPDVLMRTLFEHARAVEHAVDGLLRRASADPVPADVAPRPTPEEVLRRFADAALAGKDVPPATLDAIEFADLGARPFAWNEGMRRAFLDMLASGGPGERALEAMDRAGLLTGFLPEWTAVRCRPQRDPYHRFTVDVHLARTASAAAEALRDPGDDRVAMEAAAAVRDRDALLLGALLHDIGKTGEGHHVEVGARVAAAALARIGIEGSTAQDALFLVEHHLLLADTATRRDLTDENLVLDVAARVRTPERLAMLYLLTVADAASTGPHAWTPWRQALVRELVGKVRRVLERGQMGAGAAADLDARAGRVRELLAHEDAGAVEDFLWRMPRGYLLGVAPEAAARHFRIVSPPPGTSEVRTHARPGERTGTYDLTVIAADRPGLLASIAGALALHGLNILSAQAHTTEDGVAVDLFVVEGAFEPEIDEERWRGVRTDLRRALEGRTSLERRVAEKRRHYPPPRADISTEVTIDDGASDFFSVIEVGAPDRIGLLFDVASVLHDLGLDVHLAKVATFGGRVVDAFYVRDSLGRRLADPARAREVESAILARLENA